MSFCLRPNVCKKCGKPLTLFEGWTCLECDKAEQEPKTGHWISHHHGCEYECSECHDKQRTKSNYCPNCGCRMVEPQKSEDKE